MMLTIAEMARDVQSWQEEISINDKASTGCLCPPTPELHQTYANRLPPEIATFAASGQSLKV